MEPRSGSQDFEQSHGPAVVVASPRATSRNYRIAPPAFYGDLEVMLKNDDIRAIFRQIVEWLRLTSEVVNRTQEGKLNNLGTLTLTDLVATTTLNDKRIGARSVIQVMPTTANGANELATFFQTYPNVTQGQAVLNHANNAETDRTFTYTVTG